MEGELIPGKMDDLTKVNISMTKSKASVSTSGLITSVMKDTGSMANSTAKASLPTQREKAV